MEKYAYCRVCLNGCPLKVTLQDGVVERVSGVPGNPVYRGFTCVKGRSQPMLLSNPDRLRHSLKRTADGGFEPIPVDQAISEISERLNSIIGESGARSVAGYLGTQFAASAATMPGFLGFMQSIGTPMIFSPATIDKPGKKIAEAMHGTWQAPAVEFDDPEVILLIGSNPLITFTGFPYGNPGKWLNDRLDAGTRLLVIDPRRSDVARRAHIHMQAKPGQDVAILAAILHVILEEGIWDRDFAERHVAGIDQLSLAVSGFTPQVAAQLADVDAEQIVEAAHALCSTRRGYINAGTGPNMSGHGSLVEYLIMNIGTLCGYWLRAGDRVRNPGVLAPPKVMRAQVDPPRQAYGIGERLRSRDLGNSAAGMPTGALADEMLHEGEGRVRALISCAGNPASAWPDQAKTIRALRSLDLLVQIDPWMSATSQLADYIIAPKMLLEVPGHTQVLDWLTRYGTGYGQSEPHALYCDAVADPPPGSDLIEEWFFFYRLAQEMNLPLALSACLGPGMPPFDLDMTDPPDTVELLGKLAEGSRIPLDEVRKHPGGGVFPGEPQYVEAGNASADARFDVANPDMLAELAQHADRTASPPVADGKFKLIVRRMMHVYNSSFVGSLPPSARKYNPAFIHPRDLDSLGIEEGDRISISSEKGAIEAIAHCDDTLRPGILSMSFGFGMLDNDPRRVEEFGSNTTSLMPNDEIYDRYTGQPRMTGIDVEVEKV